jgi:hypothetical protein
MMIVLSSTTSSWWPVTNTTATITRRTRRKKTFRWKTTVRVLFLHVDDLVRFVAFALGTTIMEVGTSVLLWSRWFEDGSDW